MKFRYIVGTLLVAAVAFTCGDGKDSNGITLVNSSPNEGGPPPGDDGSSCITANQCDGDRCLMSSEGWEGGYCTTTDCASSSCNGDNAECVVFLDGSSFCLDQCEANVDCRQGYRCRSLDASGRRVCFVDGGDGPPAGEIGADCSNDADCREGLACDTEAPGGYCLVPSCGGTCPEGATCAPWGGGQQCLQACDVTRDCRIGYRCDEGVCLPSDAVQEPFPFDTTAAVLGSTCGGDEVDRDDTGVRWRTTFTVPSNTESYMVVPWVPSGSLRPVSITTPSGRVIDLVDDYRHHNVRATEFQFFDEESHGVYGEVAFDWPILFPFAPQFQELVESGEHELEVRTSTEEPCIYVLAGEPEGVALDLNVHFVGLEGFSADGAGSDPDLNAVFDGVDGLLSEAGVRIGTVRFFDAPRELAERYARVRDQSELKRATAFGAPRDETLAGHLNVDVFLVEDLTLGGTEVLGLSAGLPGPPGLHGNPANGLVFTGADIGSDNAFVAHIMAHELGHYLGLRHTTEVFHGVGGEEEEQFDAVLGTTDPIDDTPVCDRVIFLGPNCPDADNLMFPAAPAEAFDAILTEDQASVLRGNPLFRAASE